MNDLRIVIPGPPVPCERPRVVRMGKGERSFVRTFTPKRTEDYQKFVAMCALKAMGRTMWNVGGVGPFAVSVDVFREANRGDLDNYAKSAIDGLSKARVWDDDRHVVALTARMYVDKANPRIEATVRVLGEVVIMAPCGSPEMAEDMKAHHLGKLAPPRAEEEEG